MRVTLYQLMWDRKELEMHVPKIIMHPHLSELSFSEKICCLKQSVII